LGGEGGEGQGQSAAFWPAVIAGVVYTLSLQAVSFAVFIWLALLPCSRDEELTEAGLESLSVQLDSGLRSGERILRDGGTLGVVTHRGPSGRCPVYGPTDIAL
jgi:hypothetical protein